MSDFAVVIGIERYAAGFKALQGPALDALKFAWWLRRTVGVPPANIVLLLNKSDKWAGSFEQEYQNTLNAIQGEGIIVAGEPTYAAIRKAWLEDVLPRRAQRGTLWIYWSGHGVTFPRREEALMCHDVEAKEPTYVYLSELLLSLCSADFSRFDRQRIVIDACAGHVTFADLRIARARNPDSFEAVKDPDQILVTSVPVGEGARAEEGASLFTRLLLARLQETGWPDDIVAFYEALTQDTKREVPGTRKLPGIRIKSPRFEAGILPEGDKREVECRRILEVLLRCAVLPTQYQAHYLRTMGPLSSNREVLAASSRTEMITELLQLPRQAEFGGYSRGLTEWLARVHWAHRADTTAIGDWLGREIPEAGLAEIRQTLDKEQKELALVCVLTESTFDPSGLPVALGAYLCDAGFSTVVQTWNTPGIPSRPALEDELRQVLCAARSLAVKQNVGLTVHVFANPPLLDVAYHALRVDPEDEDCSSFGQLHPFLLRSRARLVRNDKYDIESWQKKAETLRKRPAKAVRIHRAPAYGPSASDAIAKIDGLLSIQEVVEGTASAHGQPPSASKVIGLALKRGLPLVTWRTAPPENGDWQAFEQKLQELFGNCPLVADVPQQLRDERRSEPWARETVLLWDDADTAVLHARVTQEPQQQ